MGRHQTLAVLTCLYSFSADGHKFILKYIHPVNFEYLREVNNSLRGNASHVRLAVDTIPDRSMFVFEHFTGHLLTLAQKNLPLVVIKRILKDALTGLAKLHEQDIVHTGIFSAVFLEYWTATYSL